MLDAVAVLLGAAATYLTRVVFLVSRKVRPPKSVDRYLKLVGPAVLAAIAVPGLLAPNGELSLLDTIPAVLAAGASFLLWKLTRQLIIGLLGGLVVWWGLLALLWGLGLSN